MNFYDAGTEYKFESDPAHIWMPGDHGYNFKILNFKV